VRILITFDDAGPTMPGLLCMNPNCGRRRWGARAGCPCHYYYCARRCGRIDAHFCGGEEGVFAAVHGGAAGMCGLAVKGNRVAFDTERARTAPRGRSEVEQHGALLGCAIPIGVRRRV